LIRDGLQHFPEANLSTSRSAFIQRYEQLPDTLPVFPLGNAVLLPGGALPLNIFEPRYLNMVEDAMQGDRLIGMIQPRDDADVPALCDVGCAGRITRYGETSDGRLEIVLTGVCRFRVVEEFPSVRGYRLVQPDWSPYRHDYDDETVGDAELRLFKAVLRSYLEQQNMQVDWELLEKLDVTQLSSNLVSALPLAAEEKQLLLESPGLQQRLTLFASLLGESASTAGTRH
jgi:Lon protease-like protein